MSNSVRKFGTGYLIGLLVGLAVGAVMGVLGLWTVWEQEASADPVSRKSGTEKIADELDEVNRHLKDMNDSLEDIERELKSN